MALPVTDTWSQTSGSSQGINTYNGRWTVEEGTLVVPNAANRLEGSGGSYSCAYVNNETFSPDQYAIATIITGNYVGVACRVQVGSGTNYYHVETNGTDFYISKGRATIAGPVTQTFANGDRIKLEVSGTSTVTLRVYRALAASPTTFVQVGTDYTDSSSPYASGPAGVFIFGNTAGAGIGQWDAGNLSAGAAATLSAPTPSGTLATGTTATVGATTDQNTGNLYVVVDSAAALAGVTASQIKSGLKANGAAAAASGSAAVSTTSPSVGITGLSSGTTYGYAIVQNNANGDSNVVTGTFTTASAPVITNASDEQFINGETITVDGTDFGASQGAGVLYISPTNNVSDGGRVAQTIVSWGSTAIVATIVRGSLSLDTPLYMFVVTNAGLSNSVGYGVQITTPPVQLDPITTCFPG